MCNSLPHCIPLITTLQYTTRTHTHTSTTASSYKTSAAITKSNSPLSSSHAESKSPKERAATAMGHPEPWSSWVFIHLQGTEQEYICIDRHIDEYMSSYTLSHMHVRLHHPYTRIGLVPGTLPRSAWLSPQAHSLPRRSRLHMCTQRRVIAQSHTHTHICAIIRIPNHSLTHSHTNTARLQLRAQQARHACATAKLQHSLALHVVSMKGITADTQREDMTTHTLHTHTHIHTYVLCMSQWPSSRLDCHT
jgi:hypothetical protein